ncbi:protein translocase subunit SecD [Sanguibacter antarcticus]|uniref:protein translocase subunit SecD n=1 Tax=Sanguibacter antarcticus TaxID=372484 RepID=UPI000BF509F1|nr:protein translocase subunit SecD [Sanguibacter antarcticus]
MATTNRKKPGKSRALVGLLIIVLGIFGSLLAGTIWSSAEWTPKRALDLEGGTQIILQPVTDNDEQVTAEDLEQAIAIIRQRVDSSGVAEAEITSQAGSNIVVALPGTPSQETLDLVRESAQMQFRPVLFFGNPAVIEPSEETAETEPATEPVVPTDPSDFAQVTPELLAEFDALDCTLPANLAGGGGAQDANAPIVACGSDGTMKYILGPMEIAGLDIDSATSGLRTNSQGTTLNDWAVSIQFNSEGADKFTEVTTRLSKLPTYSSWILLNPPTQSPGMFAMVLDNLVISAPTVEVIIADGQAEITGSFTRETATTLANQLNFGALPLTFEVQSESQISATLGSEQLQKGLIAGLIGLALVVLYSLVQYRALGLVTVASLVIAGLITYGLITLLSWTQGYRLSLPGVAGLIVAIGITADSFIVYFERIRDELRDGRSLTSAVETGWQRARRTILASDAVNFLAAIVLYFLAVGGVRGFAFTLGLTTVVDILVVFLFTHPLMRVLATTKFFGKGHRASGLDPRQLGVESVRYAGRGRVASRSSGLGTAAPDGSAPGSSTKVLVGAGRSGADDGRKMTIAERRAAQSSSSTTDHDVVADDAPDSTVLADDPDSDGPEAADETKSDDHEIDEHKGGNL